MGNHGPSPLTPPKEQEEAKRSQGLTLREGWGLGRGEDTCGFDFRCAAEQEAEVNDTGTIC